MKAHIGFLSIFIAASITCSTTVQCQQANIQEYKSDEKLAEWRTYVYNKFIKAVDHLGYISDFYKQAEGRRGTVLVIINPDGTIKELSIYKSTGSAFIDGVLVGLIGGMFPIQITPDKKEKRITIPYHFL